MKTNLLLIFLLALTGSLRGAIVTVPGAFNSIREAIDASSSGDTIVVTPGIYYENINFGGKNIVLTSLYYLSGDTSYITSTIINGSNPVHPDTGSCVIFNSFEDSTAVLQGFTITGGTGTVWLDIHGAGIYREGGGILVEYGSPTICNNIITGNIVTDMTGVISTGGGGIRVGDGNPEIRNNIISFNEARYGAGIVLNYTGCKIRNNVIASNTGGQDYFGGSAIWINNNLPATPKIIENNTIVNNYAVAPNGTGGISIWSASNVIIKNTIIYGNYPSLQIKTVSSVPQVSYCDVEGGFTGNGNIFDPPLFTSDSYLLQSGSPCIDSGDTLTVYNDVEDTSNPGNALFPSFAGLRNDIGAYGGPGVTVFPGMNSSVSLNNAEAGNSLKIYPNPAAGFVTIDSDKNLDNAVCYIYDPAGKMVKKFEHVHGNRIGVSTEDFEPGMYLIFIEQNMQPLIMERLIIVPAY